MPEMRRERAGEAGIALIADASGDFADREHSFIQEFSGFLHADDMSVDMRRHAELRAKSRCQLVAIQSDTDGYLFDCGWIADFVPVDRRGSLDRIDPALNSAGARRFVQSI